MWFYSQVIRWHGLALTFDQEVYSEYLFFSASTLYTV